MAVQVAANKKWEVGVLYWIVIKLPLCSQGISEIPVPPREKLWGFFLFYFVFLIP